LSQPARQLPGGRRLARALQAAEQNDRRLARQPELLTVGSEQRDQLVAHDLDHLLRRREAFQHILPQSSLAHPVDERLDDAEVHVGLEKSEPNLAQRAPEHLLGHPALALEAPKDSLELVL
jgi:hypothetical protein